jgi:hypothetical protein
LDEDDELTAQVVLYGPDPNSGDILPIFRTGPYALTVGRDAAGNLTIPGFAYEALPTTIGHRVLRAYLYDGEDPTADPLLLMSNIAERVVRPGGEKVDLFFD